MENHTYSSIQEQSEKEGFSKTPKTVEIGLIASFMHPATLTLSRLGATLKFTCVRCDSENSIFIRHAKIHRKASLKPKCKGCELEFSEVTISEKR